MKKIYLILMAVCLCTAVFAQKQKELLILHTNDTHSRIEPLSVADPNPEIAGKAGYVRRPREGGRDRGKNAHSSDPRALPL